MAEDSVAPLAIPPGTTFTFHTPESLAWNKGTFISKNNTHTKLSVDYYVRGKLEPTVYNVENKNVYYVYSEGTKIWYEKNIRLIGTAYGPRSLELKDLHGNMVNFSTNIDSLVKTLREKEKTEWLYDDDQKFVYQYVGSDTNKYYAEQSVRRCLDYNNIPSYELTYTDYENKKKEEVIMKEVLEKHGDTKHIPVYKTGTSVQYTKKKSQDESPYTV
ncbi:MAG: hypothetical protein ACPGLR_03870, partial [Flavobacteriaceae bacterium]